MGKSGKKGTLVKKSPQVPKTTWAKSDPEKDEFEDLLRKAGHKCNLCAKICPTAVALIDHKYYFHRIPRPGTEKPDKPSEIGVPKARILPEEIPKVASKTEEIPIKTPVKTSDVQEYKHTNIQTNK